MHWFKPRILMRPQEISNHPEMIRRLGIITINTAIEIDIFGNVNSTHVMGRQMMNGIGGSGDFTRNGYLSIFICLSTAKGGKISTIVPLVSHMDHSEHSVQVVATEWGIADLRGRDPHERAQLIIDNCAHPYFRDPLHSILEDGPRRTHSTAALGGIRLPLRIPQERRHAQTRLENGDAGTGVKRRLHQVSRRSSALTWKILYRARVSSAKVGRGRLPFPSCFVVE